MEIKRTRINTNLNRKKTYTRININPNSFYLISSPKIRINKVVKKGKKSVIETPPSLYSAVLKPTETHPENQIN